MNNFDFPNGGLIYAQMPDPLRPKTTDLRRAPPARRRPSGDLFGYVSLAYIVFALVEPAAYAIAFPNYDALLGAMNADGRLDGGDIDPFFDCLGGGACP